MTPRRPIDDGRLLHTSEHGRMCPECDQPVDTCRCEARRREQVPEGDGVVRVSRETQGRKGKSVTVVRGVLLAADPLKALAKRLRQRCSTGGTLKQGVIELQGDHVETVMAELTAQGFQVKRAGG